MPVTTTTTPGLNRDLADIDGYGAGLAAMPQSRIKQKNKSKGKTTRFNRLLFYLFPSKHGALSTQASQEPPIITVVAPPHPSRPPPTPIPAPVASTSHSRDMPHSASHSTSDLPLDIIIHNDPVVIRGVGVDYEPTTVRGIVKLSLPEATDIKEVMIRCTGKARLSVMQKEGTRPQQQTTILYLKEEDLLEGDKSHHHTLKAGRHEFPFSFELDGRLAASLSANFGMAVIEYRLRAQAVRPSFSTNYIATKDFTLVRSFTNEALEFQQTLEIENTWPDKIQYTVILPHKAWAAGDHISAILKFTPLAKGVKVASVKMNLQEKVKTVTRTNTHEEVRVVCSKKESLKRGRPIRANSPVSPPSPSAETSNNNAESDALQMMSRQRRNQQAQGQAHSGGGFFRRLGSRVQSRENLLSRGSGGGGGLFHNRTGDESHPGSASASPPPGEHSPLPSSSGNASASASPPASPTRSDSASDNEQETDDIEMVMRMRIPMDATPSHNLAPVFITHRVKWDVLISNLDGHFSELRCSLPVHLLAKEVLEETLSATNATRTALLGESHGVPVQEIILPAYQDHLRDRVAIDELYEHTLASNPLNSAVPPVPPLPTPSDEDPLQSGGSGGISMVAAPPLSSSYGPSSTLSEQFRAAAAAPSNVPRIASMPDASERGRMRTGRMGVFNEEAQSSELYLSLGRRPNTANSTSGNNAEFAAGAAGGTGSHPPSQSSSRASSPERMGESSNRGSRHTFGIKPFTVFKNKSKVSMTSSSRPPSRPGSSHNKPPKNKFSLSRTSSGPSTPSSPEPMPHFPLPRSRGSNSPTSTQTSSMQTSSVATASTQMSASPSLGDYYDAVPEYAFAAQGFLGGGITPLSALRGLPSYDQAQRSKIFSPPGSATTSQGSSTSTSNNSSNGGGRRRSGTRSSRHSGEQRPPLPPPLPSSSSGEQSRRGSGEQQQQQPRRGSNEQARISGEQQLES